MTRAGRPPASTPGELAAKPDTVKVTAKLSAHVGNLLGLIFSVVFADAVSAAFATGDDPRLLPANPRAGGQRDDRDGYAGSVQTGFHESISFLNGGWRPVPAR
jgi:hypothetical protein